MGGQGELDGPGRGIVIGKTFTRSQTENYTGKAISSRRESPLLLVSVWECC